MDSEDDDLSDQDALSHQDFEELFYEEPDLMRQHLAELLRKKRNNKADILRYILRHQPCISVGGCRIFAEHIKTIDVSHNDIRSWNKAASAVFMSQSQHQDPMKLDLPHFIVMGNPDAVSLEDVLRTVIEVQDTHINQRCEGMTPLDMACNLFVVQRYKERQRAIDLCNVVGSLLRLGAEPGMPCAVFGKTPLESARVRVDELKKAVAAEMEKRPSPGLHHYELNRLKIELRAWQDVIVQMEAYQPTTPAEGSKKRKAPSSEVDDNLLVLLGSPYYHDVRLRVGDKTFTAHRDILADRSAYFQAMFKNGMRETRLDEIPLEDVDPGLFEVMLRSIYKGTYDVRDGDTVDVVGILVLIGRFGTRFDIREITGSLQTSLTVGNAIEVYKAAAHCDLTDLMEQAKLFIIRHHADVVRSVDLSNADDCRVLIEMLRGRDYTVSLGIRR